MINGTDWRYLYMVSGRNLSGDDFKWYRDYSKHLLYVSKRHKPLETLLSNAITRTKFSVHQDYSGQ